MELSLIHISRGVRHAAFAEKSVERGLQHDADAFPMSYIEGDSYSGFDVELAREVCSRLGWTAKFISICLLYTSRPCRRRPPAPAGCGRR